MLQGRIYYLLLGSYGSQDGNTPPAGRLAVNPLRVELRWSRRENKSIDTTLIDRYRSVVCIPCKDVSISFGHTHKALVHD